jgi:hypothetical protein
MSGRLPRNSHHERIVYLNYLLCLLCSTNLSTHVQLNIYDEPEPEIVLVESPSRLEENIALAQKYVNNTYDNGMVRAVHEIDAAVATEG